jgi:hypothetical protein
MARNLQASRRVKAGIAGVAVLAAGLIATGVVAAATQLGTTSPPATNCIGPPTSFVQTANPTGSEYAVPSAGVITAWSFNAPASAPELKLKMFRSLGGSNYLVVGQSSAQTPAANNFNNFQTRIPVQAGDLVGLTILTVGPCGTNGSGTALQVAGDPPDGANVTGGGPISGFLGIGATLEADADADGFGDETQDQCPTSAATQNECVPPSGKIFKGPKAEIERTSAKFFFKSNEPGSTFRCKLKGKGVKKTGPCTSPKKYKNLEPGKFKFTLTATDPAGNVDPTPEKQKFRVLEPD